MKTLFTPFPLSESWNRNKSLLHRLFTWLTGYEIMLEESREDLLLEQTIQISENDKRQATVENLRRK